MLRALKAAAAVTLAIPRAVKSAYTGGGFSLRHFGFNLSLAWGAAWGYDYARLARLAYSNPIARRALGLIAQTMAEVPLYVEERRGDTWEAVEGRERELALVERPGGHTRQTDALRVVTALYCGGEVFVRKLAPLTGQNAGRASALRLILPDEYSETLYDKTGEIAGYRFQTRPGSRRSGRSYTLSADEVRHVRLPHPTSDERGLAVLASVAEQMEHMTKATAWNSAIASGGGRPKGYWSPKDLRAGEMLDATQVEAAQAWFDKADREASENNRDVVLSGPFERVPGDVSPKDADWIKGLAWDVDIIAAACGVPPRLIGSEKGGSLTDAGVDSEVRALYLLTVLPLLSFWLAELSAMLLPDGTRFAVDRDQIPALSEDMDAKAVRFGGLVKDGVLAVNESRVALGFEPVNDPGADIVTALFNRVPLRMIAEAPPMASSPQAAARPAPEAKSVADYLGALPAELWDPRDMAAKIAAEA